MKFQTKLPLNPLKAIESNSIPSQILERLSYNHLYNSLEMNNVIHDLMFGFRQKYSTFHTLIHVPDKIRDQLDSANFASGIFVDLHQLLMQ